MEDFQQLRQQDQVITVWGEVATLQLTVNADPEYERELSSRIFRFDERFLQDPVEGLFGLERPGLSERPRLEEAVREAVALRLGPQFQARIEVRPGSITIIIVITAIYTVYKTVAQYKSFRDGLQQLLSDVRSAVTSVLGRTVPPDQLSINSALAPGSAVLYAEAMTMFNNAVGRIRTPLIALVVSNLLLLLIAATVLILQFV